MAVYTKYYPDGWRDEPDESTPIVAAALDHVEDGIEAASIDTEVALSAAADAQTTADDAASAAAAAQTAADGASTAAAAAQSTADGAAATATSAEEAVTNLADSTLQLRGNATSGIQFWGTFTEADAPTAADGVQVGDLGVLLP